MINLTDSAECIVYTWDYHSSLSVWNGLRTQPILADEVQTFKALILVHKVLQEGHPVVSDDAHVVVVLGCHMPPFCIITICH